MHQFLLIASYPIAWHNRAEPGSVLSSPPLYIFVHIDEVTRTAGSGSAGGARTRGPPYTGCRGCHKSRPSTLFPSLCITSGAAREGAGSGSIAAAAEGVRRHHGGGEGRGSGPAHPLCRALKAPRARSESGAGSVGRVGSGPCGRSAARRPPPSLSPGWERPLWGWTVAAPPSVYPPPGSAPGQRGARWTQRAGHRSVRVWGGSEQRVCFARLVLNAELVLGGVRQSIASPSRAGIVPLCSALARPHLECWILF